MGTSNRKLDLLTERFQTRFQAVKFMPPETEELAEFLIAHWPVPKQTALQTAVGSGGCVRAALADLESWLDCRPWTTTQNLNPWSEADLAAVMEREFEIEVVADDPKRDSADFALRTR